MGRLTDDQVKARVVERNRLKTARDALLAGVDVSALEGGSLNPAALMGLMGKLGDFKQAFDMTRRIEELSDELEHEQVLRMVENV